MYNFKIGQEVEFFQKTEGSSHSTSLSVGHKGKITEKDLYNNAVRIGETVAAWVSIEDIRLVEEKKVIGYKAPYDLFGGEYKKGSIWIKSKANNSKGNYRPDNKKDTYNAMPQEIVETWEAVFSSPEVVLVLGTPRQKITVKKESIICEGKSISIRELKTILKPEFTGWNIAVLLAKYKVGCSEFDYNDLEIIVKTYEDLNK